MRATADALGNERSRNRRGDCGNQPDIRPRAIRNSQAAMSGPLSPNLKRLEAEAIAIMRETAAEFRKPVLLYLIGKDSSVNVDTTWKFRDMIAFRDQRAKATPRKSSDQAKDKRLLIIALLAASSSGTTRAHTQRDHRARCRPPRSGTATLWRAPSTRPARPWSRWRPPLQT